MRTEREQTQALEGTHFGRFGGIFVPETLFGPLQDVAAAYGSGTIGAAQCSGPVGLGVAAALVGFDGPGRDTFQVAWHLA